MASAGETKESSTITPIPDEPTFDGLRKKITNVQAEIDKTFGPGNITATVDVSQLIASEAWASMDSKSKVGKPGQQTALRYVSHFPSNVLFLDFSSSFSSLFFHSSFLSFSLPLPFLTARWAMLWRLRSKAAMACVHGL